MSKLKLTVNETKTRVCNLPEETFDFLGYTIGRCYSPKTGRAYLGTMPSKKRMTACKAISERPDGNDTAGRGNGVGKLNRMLSGGRTTSVWARSALPIGPWTASRPEARQWLRAKHKVIGSGTTVSG